mgnify:CR=1 FL=1
MNEKPLPQLPTPKFTETIRGVPCITVTEHEHLMRTYALQAIANAAQAEAKTDEMDQMFVKGALSGIVDAQVRDLWPTKQAQKGD